MGIDVAMNALVSIAALLLIGLLMTAFSKKINVSNLFLLLISGVILSVLNRFDIVKLNFSDVLLVSLSIITLVMVVFEGASSFNIKRVEKVSISALKLVGYFIFLSLVFIAPMVGFIFFDTINFTTILFGAIVAVIMAGTDPSSVFTMLKSSSNKLIQVLEVESIVNTPFTIILPIIFLEIIKTSTDPNANLSSIVFNQFKPLILEIAAGIGLGIMFGYIVAKNFKKISSKVTAPIAILTFALVAYIGADLIGGSGVLAVATMGIIFGASTIKNRENLHSFNESLSALFVLLVFILAGYIVNTNITISFLLKVLLIVIMTFMIRFVAVDMILSKKEFSIREKFFMALMMPKGVAVAVVALSLAVMEFTPGYETMLSVVVQVILLSMVFSLFFSTIVSRFGDSLLYPKIETKPIKLNKNETKKNFKSKISNSSLKTKQISKKTYTKSVKKKIIKKKK